jgi:hypothetical protein
MKWIACNLNHAEGESKLIDDVWHFHTNSQVSSGIYNDYELVCNVSVIDAVYTDEYNENSNCDDVPICGMWSDHVYWLYLCLKRACSTIVPQVQICTLRSNK